MSQYRSQFVESLEGRQLLAAQPTVAPITVVNPNLFSPGSVVQQSQQNGSQAEAKAARKAARQARKAAEPLVRSTNMEGEWEGRVKVRYGFLSKKFDIDFSIYDQTDNSISGRIEVADRDYSGTFFGKINPKNGRFQYTLEEDGDEIRLRGQLGKRGNIIGGGNVKIEYSGWDLKGSFEVNRIA